MLRQEILNNDTKTSKDDINTAETKEEEYENKSLIDLMPSIPH